MRAMLSALPWLVFLIVGGIDFLVPNSYWFQVDKVFVHDSVVGVTPSMSVARKVRHDFDGQWSVVVKQTPLDGGGFYGVCSSEGPAHARTKNIVPPDLDLDRWTFPVKCVLGPGKYFVETVWTWSVLGLQREVAADSNVFTISEAVLPPR